ncbi:MAG: hypothetical protein LUE93_07770 [Bacteroides sp.]|nr:hypothetical protein [Bacteroides sp.]
MKTTITRTTGTKSTHRVAELTRVIESLKVESKSEPVDKVRYQIRIFSGKGRPMSLNELSRINFTTHFRNRDGVLVFTTYNGLVLVTIDHLSGLKEAAHIRNKVIRLPACLLAFTGSSGHTVKALLHFTLPDGTLPTEERNALLFHVHAYRWAVNYIRSQFPENSVRIHHPSLTDSCRFSYDPGLCYKENSYPILLDQPLQMPEEVLRTEEAPPKKIAVGTAGTGDRTVPALPVAF